MEALPGRIGETYHGVHLSSKPTKLLDNEGLEPEADTLGAKIGGLQF